MQKEESYLSILKENQKKQAESGGMKISSRNNRKKQPIKRGLPDPKPIKEEEEPLEDVPEIALPIEETKEPEAVIEPEPAEEIETEEEVFSFMAEEVTDEEPEPEVSIKPLTESPRIADLGKPIDPQEAKKKIRRATLLIKEGEEEIPEPEESTPKEIRICVGESCEIVLSINVSVRERSNEE